MIFLLLSRLQTGAKEVADRAESTETLASPLSAIQDDDYLEPNEERLFQNIETSTITVCLKQVDRFLLHVSACYTF